MPIYLGTTPVSLKLGTQDVAGFLGDAAVTVVARTLYFTGAADSDWATLGNWFDDAEGTVAASSLPTAADSVIATAFIDSNSGSEPTVANFTMNDPDNNEIKISIPITVTGLATFNGGAENLSTITGNATFNDFALNVGTVTGNATFNGSSENGGAVTGNATFNDSACNIPNFGTAGTFVPDPPPACPE